MPRGGISQCVSGHEAKNHDFPFFFLSECSPSASVKSGISDLFFHSSKEDLLLQSPASIPTHMALTQVVLSQQPRACIPVSFHLHSLCTNPCGSSTCIWKRFSITHVGSLLSSSIQNTIHLFRTSICQDGRNGSTKSAGCPSREPGFNFLTHKDPLTLVLA